MVEGAVKKLSRVSLVKTRCIKMPDQVPPGVSRAFEVLVPATLTLIITACIGSAYYNITGLYLNDIIKTVSKIL